MENSKATQKDLVEKVRPVFEKIMGVKLSRKKVWAVYRAAIGASAALAQERGSLALWGIGTWSLGRSKRSVEKNLGFPLRLRFRAGNRLTEVLNSEVRTFEDEFLRQTHFRARTHLKPGALVRAGGDLNELK